MSEMVGADVVDSMLGQLAAPGKSLARPKAHVGGIADQNADLASSLQECVDASCEGFFAEDIQGNRAHVNLLLFDEGRLRCL